MNRKVVLTNDGTTTIQLVDKNEQYHSMHGALNEANHVFIKNGFEHLLATSTFSHINILEVGLGTYLNSLLTFIAANNKKITIHYSGIEPYPINDIEAASLNYAKQLHIDQKTYVQFHEAEWNATTSLSVFFKLHKMQANLQEITLQEKYDLVYYDAFGFRTQPEMWDLALFKKIHQAMKPNGVLVTYCAKGQVRRDLSACGFTVEKLEGPPGKREMLRATKVG